MMVMVLFLVLLSVLGVLGVLVVLVVLVGHRASSWLSCMSHAPDKPPPQHLPRHADKCPGSI